MDHPLQRLLWRFESGLIGPDRLTKALEKRCRDLVDRRYREQEQCSEIVATSASCLRALGEVDSSLALTRAHLGKGELRAAYLAVIRAESALERMLGIVEASRRHAEARQSWSRLIEQLDLEPLRHLATLRSIDRTFQKIEEHLAQEKPERARVVTSLALRLIAKLQQTEEPRAQRTGHLEGQLQRWLDVHEHAVLERLRPILESGYTELGRRLLADWELGNEPPVKEAVTASPPTTTAPPPVTSRIDAIRRQAETLTESLSTFTSEAAQASDS